MLRAVFFDLGNTLVDYHAGGLSDDEKELLGLRNVDEALIRLGHAPCLGRLRSAFYAPWQRSTRHRSRRRSEPDFLGVFSGALPRAAARNAALVRRLVLAFHEPYLRFVRAQPGALELLRALGSRGITVGMISNTAIPGYCHDAALERLGMREHLAFRLFSLDEGERKPYPRMFEHALRLSGARASESAMVGDSLRLDIEPAIRLGMRAYGYTPEGAARGRRRANRHVAFGSYERLGRMLLGA